MSVHVSAWGLRGGRGAGEWCCAGVAVQSVGAGTTLNVFNFSL